MTTASWRSGRHARNGFGARGPWYVPLALEARRRGFGSGIARACVIAAVVPAALLASGCGGGGERQDADESEGDYKVAVLEANFPSGQKLAKESELEFAVKNIGDKEIQNLAITFGRNTPRGRIDSLDRRSSRPRPLRSRPPRVRRQRPTATSVASPRARRGTSPPGSGTAYVDTYALGKLAPNKTKRFAFSVTAVVAGPYRIVWALSAGLDGKAKAILASGLPAVGQFEGTIKEKPPKASVSGRGREDRHQGRRVGPSSSRRGPADRPSSKPGQRSTGTRG